MRFLRSVFRRKTTVTTSVSTDAMMAMYFGEAFMRRLGRAASADELDAFRYMVGAKGLEQEEVAMLPKDLLSELEVLDEKRVNEHLNKSEDARMVQPAMIWNGNAGIGSGMGSNELLNQYQQMANQQMNRDIERTQQMFASAQSFRSFGGLSPRW